MAAHGGGKRRRARERALAILYEADTRALAPCEVLDGLDVRPDPLCVEIVRGVERELARIDDLIAHHAVGWKVARMPVVDRAVLRLGVAELLGAGDVPAGAAHTPGSVVLSEAVELASQYSTEESARFVNGVLSGVAEELGVEGVSRQVRAKEGGGEPSV